MNKNEKLHLETQWFIIGFSAFIIGAVCIVASDILWSLENDIWGVWLLVGIAELLVGMVSIFIMKDSDIAERKKEAKKCQTLNISKSQMEKKR